MNVSSEGLDLEEFEVAGFCCNGQVVWAFSLASRENAEDNLNQLLETGCPDCVDARTYCADATCPDGTLLASFCVPTSQADADALAKAAEDAMRPFCDDITSLFSATCSCPDGSNSITVYSAVSVEDALAICEAIPKVCDTHPCNDPQICSVQCPDGGTFTWYQAACTVFAGTVEEANARAHALACQRAAELRICLTPINLCKCAGVAFTERIRATGVVPQALFWSIVSGSIPPGMTFSSGLSVSGSATVSGTPLANGTYTFTVRAATAAGSFAEATYSLVILEITTATLADYIVGTPYSVQLTAAGGSGNYTWDLVSGTLPAGLVFDPTGLLHGTPTVSGALTSLVFKVTDLTCEAVTQRKFTPLVSMSTRSDTTLVSKIGYQGFITGSLYHEMTWSGFSEQNIRAEFSTPAGLNCSHCRFDYAGTSILDNAGNWVAQHQKIFSKSCPSSPVPIMSNRTTGDTFDFGMPVVDNGYCWAPDPRCCNPCPATLTTISNIPRNTTHDDTRGQIYFGFDHTLQHSNGMIAADDTHANAVGLAGVVVSYEPNQVVNFPTGPINLQTLPWITVVSTNDLHVVLSNPVTDAEAEALAVHLTQDGNVAEWFHDYTFSGGGGTPLTLYSRYTLVEYTLKMTNLVSGENYIVSVTFTDNTGSVQVYSIPFTATGTTKTMTQFAPTPVNGQWIKVSNPTVRYA